MKRKFFCLTALLLAVLTAAALSACGGDPSSVPEDSSVVSSEPSVPSSQPEESSGAEKAADALIAVSALVAVGAAGSLIMLNRKKRED